MTSLFAHDDAVGTTLHGTNEPIKAAARICRWAADVVGLEEPTDQNIRTALEAEGLATISENVVAVRLALIQRPTSLEGTDDD